ncbi:MAG: sulfonate transport system substrate-binding protein [Actinomycetota bacterium]|nr:sulfonate transport system substrate-binding protein [Actinomycetota bacterium]
MKLRRTPVFAALLGLLATTAACGTSAAADSDVTVTIGYQSKTINTVNAGTLLRSLKLLEKRLQETGKQNGKTYTVVWKDYDTGAPITAQMLAGKIDVGSMGDYPMLINGSKTAKFPDARTELIATTGYNAKGALNSVVVPPSSTARTLADLKGKKISTSFGSAGHGMVVRALKNAGLSPADVTLENQGPSVGSSSLQAGSVDALSQFVAWPGLLVFKGQARLLYDGADVNVPTLHGVVARKAYTGDHPEVIQAFLGSVIDATNYLHAKPLDSAEKVAAATGLPAEVVYLYNGPNGIATFDPTIKPTQKATLKQDLPFLTSIGVLKQQLDVTKFVNDTYLRKAYGAKYDSGVANNANPAKITGTDATCHRPVTDPATSGEVWLRGETTTHPASSPTCLLRAVRSAASGGKQLRAAYVPDASTGTRWFADKSIWVSDPKAPAGARLLPFTTPTGAGAYVAKHPGAITLSYQAALAAA